MIKALSLSCVIVFLVSSAFAQSGYSDRCEVGVADLTTRKNVRLGTFNTVVGEEELTTKAFRLPQTNLYIVASVFYTDESLASEKGLDSVSLEVALSPRQKRDVIRSLVWAQAEMPLSGFDVGRVAMTIKARGHPQLVVMECRKEIRR